MHASRRTALLTGLAFFAGMVFLGNVTIVRQKENRLRTPVYYPLRLETAEGLKVGARVQILGVPAGVVDSLYYLDPAEGGNGSVVALLAITEPVVFYPDYRIITRYPTALAAKEVEINPGTARNGRQPIGPRYLDSKEVVTLRRTGIMPEGPMLVAANFDDPLYQVAVVLTENRSSLRRITRNLQEITGKINEGGGTLSLILNRPDLAEGTNNTLKGAIILLQEIRDGLEDTRESRTAIDFFSGVVSYLGGAN